MDTSVIVEAPSGAGRRGVVGASRQYTWKSLRTGGCTMLGGAAWTLSPDGTATFEAAVVSAADGGTWVIWHVDLLGADDAVLGSLAAETPEGGDWRKVVLAVPDPAGRHVCRARATFDRQVWGRVARLKMYCSR